MADKIGAADCRKIAPPARRDMPEGNAAGAVVALSFQTFLRQSAKAAVEAKAETWPSRCHPSTTTRFDVFFKWVLSYA